MCVHINESGSNVPEKMMLIEGAEKRDVKVMVEEI